MMTPPISDGVTFIWRRLDRAEEHREALQRDLRRLEEAGTFLRVQPNAEKTALDVFVNLPEDRWALMVSDALHNLRSALDNLAYRLHEAHSGPPSLNAARRIGFPIFTVKTEFDSQQGSYISGMHEGAAALIARAQPYNRASQPEFHPLAVLHELSNRDKHRKPHLAYIRPDSLRAENPTGHPVARTWVTSESSFADGVHVMSIEFATPMPKGMPVHFDFKGHVGILYTYVVGRGDEAVEHAVLTPLDSTLRGIQRRVQRVARVLRPFLEPPLARRPSLCEGHPSDPSPGAGIGPHAGGP